ncbi:MAG: UDP-N-acetylmuramoyl-tripeptide--D-alanyl-D-alanine ligase, partial [Colwellia sp.]|nr:UDP-N-acetylmuramoyl-tripeptide--D-alanyl-D-alanine ligase [Colwellia sp.]
MIKISLATLAEITHGQLFTAENQSSHSQNDLTIDDLYIDDLVTDSRAIDENSAKVSAFLALKGPSFDGHRFAQQVIEQGGQLLIVDH